MLLLCNMNNRFYIYNKLNIVKESQMWKTRNRSCEQVVIFRVTNTEDDIVRNTFVIS